MWEKLKRKWEENPLEVIMVGASVAVAATVVMNGVSSMRSRAAYARAIDYRIAQGK